MAKVNKNDAEGTEGQKKEKKKKASRACMSCQRSHLTCSDTRPCVRCIKRGEECVEGAKKLASYMIEPEEAARIKAQRKLDRANKPKGPTKRATTSKLNSPPRSAPPPPDPSSSETQSTDPTIPSNSQQPSNSHPAPSTSNAVDNGRRANEQHSAFPAFTYDAQHQHLPFPDPSSTYSSNPGQGPYHPSPHSFDGASSAYPTQFSRADDGYSRASAASGPSRSRDGEDRSGSSLDQVGNDEGSDSDGSQKEDRLLIDGSQSSLHSRNLHPSHVNSQTPYPSNDIQALSQLFPPSAPPSALANPSASSSNPYACALSGYPPEIISHLHLPPQQSRQEHSQHQQSYQPQLHPFTLPLSANQSNHQSQAYSSTPLASDQTPRPNNKSPDISPPFFLPQSNGSHVTSEARDLRQDLETPCDWASKNEWQDGQLSTNPAPQQRQQTRRPSHPDPLPSYPLSTQPQQQSNGFSPSHQPTQSSLVHAPATGTVADGAKTAVVGTLLGADQYEDMFKGLDLPLERKNGNGYRRLIQYFNERYGEMSALQILKILSELRPKMLSLTATHTVADTTLIEATFHRTLIHLQQTLFPFTGTPTAIWRRTGEIVAVSPEFSILTEWSLPSLIFVNENGGVEKKSWRGRYVWEILERQSVVEYFEKFAERAFDECRGGGDTGGSWQSCVTLLTPDVRPINCCAVFSVKRDMFDLPLMIIGSFLPFL